MPDAGQAAPSTEDVWRALAEKAIGGGLDRLSHAAMDGIQIAPLYERSRVDPGQPWRSGGWSVAGRLDHPDPRSANELALLDLEGGADALTIVTSESEPLGGFGLPHAHLEQALEGVQLDFIGLRLDAGSGVPEAVEALSRIVVRRRWASAALTIDVGYDPIGLQARSGTASDFGDLDRVLETTRRTGVSAKAMLADGRPYHEAGAGEATELAAVLATGVAHLRRLEAAGLSLDAARDQMSFLLAFDAEVFLGLAKARAMRRLWARIETACGLMAKPIRLHAETSWRMMTRRDPWTNVMRTTAATFAAGVGGVDTITVLPFTAALGLPDAAARRLARNVQRVLIDEANLAKVDDPAAGAGGLEALTAGLCERAWSLFQAIEAEGGIEASLRIGTIQSRIADTARTRAEALASLRAGIVGTNRFPSLGAPAPVVLAIAPRPHGRTNAHGALPSRRDAAPFEALRERADAISGGGDPPRMFLATLGPPASFGARATYATTFFAAAGIDAHDCVPQQSMSVTVAQFQDSKSKVACICGSDEIYSEQASAMAEALRAAGARLILIAGRSGENAAAWLGAGVDDVIHDGCDALHILGKALDRI